MTNLDILHQRLHNQHIVGTPFEKPGDVVQWLGAVQAQDYLGAKWALGLRMQNATDNVIEQAFTEGSILRTHVMRPTWHFVTRADIRWMLALTSPRVKALLAYMDRRLELDDSLISRSNAVIAKALQGGKQLTREALGSALAEAGIVAEGQRLLHLVMYAELDAVVCSGPRLGKQFTYMLLDERAPQARILDRDEALAKLIRRYYMGHGPATVQDFAWWSGLTMADTKAGLEMVGSHLSHEVIEDQTYWFSELIRPAAEQSQAAFLLPTFDEFLVGFTGFDKSRRGEREATKNGIFDPPIVIGGRVTGQWRRTLKKGTAIIELASFAPWTTAESEAISAAAQRYGEFVGMAVVLS